MIIILFLNGYFIGFSDKPMCFRAISPPKNPPPFIAFAPVGSGFRAYAEKNRIAGRWRVRGGFFEKGITPKYCLGLESWGYEWIWYTLW